MDHPARTSINVTQFNFIQSHKMQSTTENSTKLQLSRSVKYFHNKNTPIRVEFLQNMQSYHICETAFIKLCVGFGVKCEQYNFCNEWITIMHANKVHFVCDVCSERLQICAAILARCEYVFDEESSLRTPTVAYIQRKSECARHRFEWTGSLIILITRCSTPLSDGTCLDNNKQYEQNSASKLLSGIWQRIGIRTRII